MDSIKLSTVKSQMVDNAISTVIEKDILGKKFTIYGTPEEPLFLAKDVAEMIEHSDVSTMVRSVDDDEKLIQTLFVSGQNRESWFLTENGLYEVLMQSRKPIAKDFKKGVKAILREIRLTGQYGGYKVPTTFADALQLAADQQRKIEEQQRLIAVQKPKAEYFDAIVERNLLTNFRDTAKELHMKQNEFISKLVNGGFIYRDTKNQIKPIAQYVNDGWFEIKEYKSGCHAGNQTLLTPKGREAFRQLFIA